MVTNVVVPQLDPAMKEARIVRWLKSEGDTVERGETILEIETDKALVEVEAPTDGTLGRLLGVEDTVLAVGELLTSISTPDEGLHAEDHAAEGKEDVQNPLQGPGVGATRGLADSNRESKASPYARRLAAQLNLDLSQVKGTGERGRITSEDVSRAAGLGGAAAISGQEEAQGVSTNGMSLQGVRALVASRMLASHQNTAPVTLTLETSAHRLVALRDRLSAEHAERLGFAVGFNEILMVMTARVLKEFPYMNARLEDGVIKRVSEIHIALAVDTERGLVTPVVRDAARKDLEEIARELSDLTERATAGKLMLSEMGGSTFTITNLGMIGIDVFTPIINFPEAAILGVGSIRDRPTVVDGELAIRKSVWLSLTFDHRLNDGAPAARFLRRLADLVSSADI